MFEKKHLIINCDVCDARKIQEESLSGYEQIVLNADIVLMDDRSRAVFNKIPMICNADEFLDVEGEVEVAVMNDSFEINGSVSTKEHLLLVINEDLLIRPGSEKQLQSYDKIVVNGHLYYPQSLSSYLGNIKVNGERFCYPEESKILKNVLELDEYFLMRAREKTSYFVGQKLLLTNPKIDVQTLLEKQVDFVTKKLVVLEEKLPNALLLVDEETELEVIPKGFSYIQGNQKLQEKLLRKYGKRLYIDGNLTIDLKEAETLKSVEGLIVQGEISIPASLEETLHELEVQYRSLQVTKGKTIGQTVKVIVDTKMLEQAPEGIRVSQCAYVKIKEDVKEELILEKLILEQCAKVQCTPEQRSAVEVVASSVAQIDTGKEEEENILSKLLKTKVVNADKYIL